MTCRLTSWLRNFAAVLWGVALIGCANVPSVELSPEDLWTAHSRGLAEVRAWTAEGRLGLELPKDSHTVYVDWRQREQDFEIRLNGPLGQGLIELSGGPDAVRMETAEGDVSVAATAEELMRNRLGWSLPVSGLEHWLLGRPDPGAATDARVLDALGRLARLEQHGWVVSYLGYVDVDGLVLPRKLGFQRPGVKAKVFVRNWALDNP